MRQTVETGVTFSEATGFQVKERPVLATNEGEFKKAVLALLYLSGDGEAKRKLFEYTTENHNTSYKPMESQRYEVYYQALRQKYGVMLKNATKEFPKVFPKKLQQIKMFLEDNSIVNATELADVVLMMETIQANSSLNKEDLCVFIQKQGTGRGWGSANLKDRFNPDRLAWLYDVANAYIK